MALTAARHLRPACDRLLAVMHPASESLAHLLSAEGFESIICPEADAGVGHSLAAGVCAAPDAAGWIVALADMPFITQASHQAVAARLRAGASLVASEYEGRRGHPVGFAGRWRNHLQALTGDQGGKGILEAHRDELLLCRVNDPGVLRDIDRIEDLKP